MTATAAATARTRPINTDEAMGHVPATMALTFLTFVTAISLCRVFPDWAYLRPMLVVCFGVHAVMYLLRVLRVNAWLALPTGLVAMAVLIGLIYFRDSTRFGLPTTETIDQFRISMRLVWRQFPRAVSPVPSEGSFAIAATTALGVCAWLADSFAFRAYGRAEAIVPTGVVFIFTSALGVDRNRVQVAALWVGAAILTIAALRMAHARDDSAWMGKPASRCGPPCPRRWPVRCSPRPVQSPSPRNYRVPVTRRYWTPATAMAMSPRSSARWSTSGPGSSTVATSNSSPFTPPSRATSA